MKLKVLILLHFSVIYKEFQVSTFIFIFYIIFFQVVPYGKATLQSMLEFISKNQEDPDTHSYEKIAENYKLSTENTGIFCTFFFDLCFICRLQLKYRCTISDCKITDFFILFSKSFQ